MTAGAEVVRLRATEEASMRGHALLIGAPLWDLTHVDEAITCMSRWLEQRGFEVVARTGSTKAEIEQQMRALADAVEPGDAVWVLYAGHGHRVEAPEEVFPDPRVVLMPMDATTNGAITGGQWQQWLWTLSARARDGRREVPGVTVVLDCCNAIGTTDAWPQGELGERLDTWITQQLRTIQTRDAVPPDVVQVFATRRNEKGRVSALTCALVGLLRAHVKEPWWALQDRLRARWERERLQRPCVVGSLDRVPFSRERWKRPDRTFLVDRRDDGWRLSIGQATGWTAGQPITLASSPWLPAQASARVSEDVSTLQVVDSPGGWTTEDGFAWARPASLAPRAVVALIGEGPLREEAQRRLARRVGRIVDHPTRAGSRAPEPVARLEVRTDGMVEVLDRHGEVVACTSMDADAEHIWLAWIERLSTLEQWLAVASASAWKPRGLTLRWGTWTDGRPTPWSTTPPTIPAGAPLWLEVEVESSERGAVTVFRVLADRTVEDLTAGEPGGLAIGALRPKIQLGSLESPLRFSSPASATSGKRRERMVIIVSQRPVLLSSLALGRVETLRLEPAQRGAERAPTSLAMEVLEYWLE